MGMSGFSFSQVMERENAHREQLIALQHDMQPIFDEDTRGVVEEKTVLDEGDPRRGIYGYKMPKLPNDVCATCRRLHRGIHLR